ncbi:MAG: hypothetical protein ABEK59_07900 [Halobacteria archaeon]
MERRNFIKASALTATGFAGCMSKDENGNGGQTGNGSGAGNGTDENKSRNGRKNQTDQKQNETDEKQNQTDEKQNQTDEKQGDKDGKTGKRKIVNRNFEVRDTACGGYTNTAEVKRDGAGSKLTVNGTVSAEDGTKTAKLKHANYNPSTDTVLVAVDTEDKSGGGMGVQCLTDIDYQLHLQMEGGLPENVRVYNKGVESDAVKSDRIKGAMFEYDTGDGTGSGKEKDGPYIERNTEDNKIEIDGTVAGNNSCMTPVLKKVSYNKAKDQLNVSIETINPTPHKACAMVVMNLDYEAQVSFEGKLPKKVSVSHDGKKVSSTMSKTKSSKKNGTGD